MGHEKHFTLAIIYDIFGEKNLLCIIHIFYLFDQMQYICCYLLRILFYCVSRCVFTINSKQSLQTASLYCKRNHLYKFAFCIMFTKRIVWLEKKPFIEKKEYFSELSRTAHIPFRSYKDNFLRETLQRAPKNVHQGKFVFN